LIWQDLELNGVFWKSMQGQPDSSVMVEDPLGFLPARVEEKTGRLKLPVPIAQSLAARDCGRLFITTFDKVSVHLYPLPIWREKLAMLSQSGGEGAVDRAKLRGIANHYGADTEVDASGRLVLPTTLRRAMGLEGATVYLECINGWVDLYGDNAYTARLAEAEKLLIERPNVLAEYGLL
jgi:DNA-binding transcriptional regulator/RsmH inhibitor MraZ